MESRTNPSGSLILIALGVGLSAIPALACSLVSASFRDTFASFGAEISGLTYVVLNYHMMLWLIPLAVACAAKISKPHLRGRRTLALGLVSLMVLLPVCAVAMYLPIYKLGAAVG
ncbi:hypothetical protein H4F99_14335 [Lysobacter sp. SG-8]|uniref:Uncharacterized protein n=1 Tax=Marilutibacter penaei TaxID=2759900 RepID=A0A7W3YFR4_9GAMM|nr:hypothetical protein [Lysobacter penaei]